MNPHLLNAAPFNSDEEENKNIREENNKRLSSSLNRTIKNRNNNENNDNKNRERNRRIQKLLNDNNMNNNLTNNESDDLEDFNPPSHPAIQEPKKIVKENFTFDKIKSELLDNQQEDELENQQQNDNPVNKENFQQLPANNLQQYYEKYNAYLNSENNYNKQYMSVSNEELLKKIDNILFLLEDQRETRTNYVTEELILYVFLGIFVIYLVDSFVKVGKYIR
tara:strand:+ start:1766 stop:2431 length:666 start_codon:yes stop_codon:yes gene_type:complete